MLLDGPNKIFHASGIATSSKLSTEENIEVVHFMETEVIKLAKRKQFVGILTLNSNPLTQVRIKTVFVIAQFIQDPLYISLQPKS